MGSHLKLSSIPVEKHNSNHLVYTILLGCVYKVARVSMGWNAWRLGLECAASLWHAYSVFLNCLKGVFFLFLLIKNTIAEGIVQKTHFLEGTQSK